MRRKPLFPPPQDARSKRKANKGRRRTTFLTINGRISLQRRWWHSSDEGSDAPADRCLLPGGENVTPGVREMCRRLNNDGVSFDQVAENLERTAQILSRARRTGLRGQKRKAATKLLNYMVERRDFINYLEFLEKGGQIGSGPTEARCKTSTTHLKRFGQRWDMCHAEEIAALGNLRDSGQGKDYWASVVRPRA